MKYERLYKDPDVKKFLLLEMEITLADERFNKLYKMISNPQKRVNDDDKQWVAYSTDVSENDTVVEAMEKILNLPAINWILIDKDKVKAAIIKVGDEMVERNIKNKPRIPFYILLLNKVVK